MGYYKEFTVVGHNDQVHAVEDAPFLEAVHQHQDGFVHESQGFVYLGHFFL